jgi:predicted AlkP superfamily phosphohydrolase/phosphomutase
VNQDKKNKVLVIGLDGATFDLIDPWIGEGRLPVLAECIRRGTRSCLESTPLSNSAQAWSSFITGKNPGKHGIYDFFETRSDSYGVRFLNASFRKGQSLWRLVSDAGMAVGVMNVPITYPPGAVNGFLIPGLDSPGVDWDFAYPKGLMEEVNREVGGYILEAGIWGHIRQGRPDKALQGLLDMVRTRTATAEYLMERKDWNLFVMVYTATDKVQHHFWKYIDPTRPESQGVNPYRDAIYQVYQEIDRGLERLLETAGDASVIIMSDHGAGPSGRRTMYINRWLSKEGFLHYKDSGGLSGQWSRLKYGALDRLYNEIKKRLPRNGKETLLRLFPNLRDKVDSVLFLPGIDWSRTVAYSRENHPAIFINTKGRETEGQVEPGPQYEKIRKDIVERLRGLRCPDTGKPIAGKIFVKEELYHGPEAYKAPDIVFQWNEFLYVHRPSGSRPRTDFLEILDDKTLVASENTTRPSGIHRDDGIFAGCGASINRGNTLDKASIYDLAPTILYLLGLPIPADMDGRVLEEAIQPDFLGQNPVKKGEAFATAEERPQGFDLDETRAIQERLQGLGYID